MFRHGAIKIEREELIIRFTVTSHHIATAASYYMLSPVIGKCVFANYFDQTL